MTVMTTMKPLIMATVTMWAAGKQARCGAECFPQTFLLNFHKYPRHQALFRHCTEEENAAEYAEVVEANEAGRGWCLRA